MSRTRLRKNVLPAPYSPMMKRTVAPSSDILSMSPIRAATSTARPTWMWRNPSRGTTPAARACMIVSRSRAVTEGVPFILGAPHFPDALDQMRRDEDDVAVLDDWFVELVERPFVDVVDRPTRQQLHGFRETLEFRLRQRAGVKYGGQQCAMRRIQSFERAGFGGRFFDDPIRG